MGRGSKIYHRFGLKWALAYRFKRLQTKFKNKSPSFLRQALMFFKILKLKNSHKFKIYGILIQCHCIIEKQKVLEFVAQHYDEIFSWVNSGDFKEQYIQTNHPYPPLLNPKGLTKDSKNPYSNLSYESISAELAWDLNLPLPQSDMVKFESHGVGGIFLSFLSRIGIPSVLQKDLDYNCKEIYASLFYAFNNGARILSMGNYLTINTKEGKKLCSLIQKPKILTLNQVRDPIGMLKHYIAFKRRPQFAMNQFNLKDNSKQIVSTLVRYAGKKGALELKPSVNAIPPLLDKILNADGSYICFHDGQLFEELINIQENEVDFMDMSEILGEKTLQTMSKFAKIFNVSEPKPEDKEFFLTKNSDLHALLPLVLYADEISDIKSTRKRIKIYITSKLVAGDKIDISLEMLGYTLDKVLILIAQEDLEQLRLDTAIYQQTKEYLQELIKEVMNQYKAENEKKLTETDILRFMRENPEARKKFKIILDRHLSLIQKRAPNIVKSWKYYQEFIKICEELD